MADRWPPCMAGSLADFGGRWTIPCLQPGNNVLHFSMNVGGPVLDGAPTLWFCDLHMAELIEAGLIEEPNVPDDEARRRGHR